MTCEVNIERQKGQKIDCSGKQEWGITILNGKQCLGQCQSCGRSD